MDKKYRLEGGLVAHFSEQDDYKLVEQKPVELSRKELDKLEEEIVRLSTLNLDANKDSTEISLWKTYFLSLSHKQKFAEWSEEDEKMINKLIDFMLSGIDISKAPYGCVAWLKSLRPQPKQEVDEQIETIAMHLDNCGNTAMAEILRSCNLRPQKRWKPSEEQLKALKEAVDEHFDIDGDALWHLYEDLKKLRVE